MYLPLRIVQVELEIHAGYVPSDVIGAKERA